MLNIDKETLARIVDDAVKAEREAIAAIAENAIESLAEDPEEPDPEEWAVTARKYGRIWIRALLRDIKARGES